MLNRLSIAILVPIVALLASCGFPTSGTETGTETAPDRADDRPVVLLISGGGFIFEASQMRYPERVASELGFRPDTVHYPTFDLRGAVRAVRAAAHSEALAGHEVYAYGESAGGTLAALLAQERLVRASATYCPVANLGAFVRQGSKPEFYLALINADHGDLRRYSPGLYNSARPILAMRGVDDSRLINRPMRRWDRRDRDVRSIPVPGGHLGPVNGRTYRRNVSRGLTWLARSAGLR